MTEHDVEHFGIQWAVYWREKGFIDVLLMEKLKDWYYTTPQKKFNLPHFKYKKFTRYWEIALFGELPAYTRCSACWGAFPITQEQLERYIQGLVKAYKYFQKRKIPLAESILPRCKSQTTPQIPQILFWPTYPKVLVYCLPKLFMGSCKCISTGLTLSLCSPKP